MPYIHCWEQSGVVKRFSGFVTADEFVRSAEEIAAHPRFESVRYIINDFAACEGHSIDADALERIAVIRFGSMGTNRNIRVVVVTGDYAFTALADAVHRPPLLGTYETVASPDLAQARAWLAQQPPLSHWRGA